MTPLDRLRIEKAAADCGFEMTPTEHGDGLKLRSATFPESILVRSVGLSTFEVTAANALMVDAPDGTAAVEVQGYGALYDVLRTAAAHARTLPNRVADAFRRDTAGMPRSTEAERLVVQRVGQNLFRSALLDYWQGQCCVTGLDVPELLRASHIKPWASCDGDDERLDVFNGLLLAPHVDALFDGGWVSFADDGRVLVSDALLGEAQARLSVSTHWCAKLLRPEHCQYLAFHRLHQFRRSR
ncbi:HNH endonuclease [Rhizobacter sp. SG703]|uniref:HNH endonuclease n=1 Tax=Rhizobacter sp. SG703 TaxID=2587140 RepID=UPI0014454EC8|nr:HNH endonuclease [Rhizobacter sp. SG703]NKI93503.1 putative restriction endonuclease [Rhizobacter sp. SG703]